MAAPEEEDYMTRFRRWFPNGLRRKRKMVNNVDNFDPFSIEFLGRDLNSGKYGIHTQEIPNLRLRRQQRLEAEETTDLVFSYSGRAICFCSEEIDLNKPVVSLLTQETEQDYIESQSSKGTADLAAEHEQINDKGLHDKEDDLKLEEGEGQTPAMEDDLEMEEGDRSGNDSDSLNGIWNEMASALECSKDPTADSLQHKNEAENEENCEHFFILKDDIGEVCWICGIIKRSIESIIAYNFSKV